MDVMTKSRTPIQPFHVKKAAFERLKPVRFAGMFSAGKITNPDRPVEFTTPSPFHQSNQASNTPISKRTACKRPAADTTVHSPMPECIQTGMHRVKGRPLALRGFYRQPQRIW